MRQLLIGCGLVVLAFLAVSGFSLWEDGGKWAVTHQTPRRAAEGRQNPSYLSAGQFQWTTPAVLKD